MRILMLHPHDLRYDPWTVRITALARGIVRRGHEVTVGFLPKKTIHEHDCLLRNIGNDNPFPIVQLGPRHSDLIRNFRTLCQLAESSDVIHIQKCFASVACPAVWAAYQRVRPIHLDWDDNESALASMTAPDRLWAHLIQVWEHRLPFLVDSISVSSEGIRRLALAKGFPEATICKVPVGADLEMFSPARNDPDYRSKFGIAPNALVVLYCGQLEGAAYADLAIDAASIVRKTGKSIHLVVVGGGRGLPALQKKAAQLGSDEITLTGYLPAHLVPIHLASADVALACFEDNEATRCKSPLKIAEYLASGLPIIGSDVGEVREMVGDAGFVVSPGNSEALADGILRYYDDPDLRHHHQQLARTRAETVYHWQRSADTLLEAYQRLIS